MDIIIIWTDYIKYRASLRSYSLETIEEILKYSRERYYDTATGRAVAVGKHDDRTVIIPYDENEGTVTPVTIHAVTRKQINFRIKSGRFSL